MENIITVNPCDIIRCQSYMADPNTPLYIYIYLTNLKHE